MSTYDQRTFSQHSHRFMLDIQSQEMVCIGCGKLKGAPEQKLSKYKNQRSTYDGYTYQSKLEAEYAQQLDWMLKAKEIKSWRRQVPLELRVNGHLVTTYRVDFEVLLDAVGPW